MRELELIDALEALFASANPRVVRGLGDDAAVVRARGYAVTSVDMMVDGVHFRSSQLSGEEIGHRALAAALSDLAAMGAEAGEAYMVLGAPPGFDLADALAVANGARALAAECGVTIAGGDFTRADALTVSLTVVGWSDDPATLVGREGARVGDVVCVTGTLGDAGAALAAIEGRVSHPQRRERYARPRPRLAEGRALAAVGASAMIDLSDGLATDAGHLGRRSGVRLALSLGALPVTEAVEHAAAELGVSAGELAATAGDDYELCACVPPGGQTILETDSGAWASATPLTWVGQVVDGEPGVEFTDADGPLSGWEHSLSDRS
jgi:thiamine-monophosphate kinase